MIGQPEVVVRAQQQHRLAVEDHARPLRPAHHPHAPMDAELFELRQPVLHVEHAPPVGVVARNLRSAPGRSGARATVRCSASAHSPRRADARRDLLARLRRHELQGHRRDAGGLRDLQAATASRIAYPKGWKVDQTQGLRRRLERDDHAARPRQDAVRGDPALDHPRRGEALRQAGEEPPRGAQDRGQTREIDSDEKIEVPGTKEAHRLKATGLPGAAPIRSR